MARPAPLPPQPPLPHEAGEGTRAASQPSPLSRAQGEGSGVRGHLARLRCGSTVVLLAIVALAAALRLPHLASNPGWDGDEGYNYNIAFNLAHGHHQMFALDFAFVQHPPLFFALAAGLFHLLGPGMLALRLLSVAFCLGTLALLPALGRMVVAPPTAIVTTEAQRYAEMNDKPLRASMSRWWNADAGTRGGLLAALAY